MSLHSSLHTCCFVLPIIICFTICILHELAEIDICLEMHEKRYGVSERLEDGDAMGLVFEKSSSKRY